MLISHFGTFDVDNYGDLLFPQLLRKQTKKMQKCELEFVSPVGGSPVLTDSEKSICVTDVLQRKRPFDAAIVGGGNIIHMMPSALSDYKVADRGLIGYPDLWLGVSLNASENVPVVWNAPGVPGPFEIEHHELVRRALERVDYISVRDEISRQHLLDVCPHADITVVPDSAWLICDVWPEDELQAVYENIFSDENIATPERTVAFHLNKRYLDSLSYKEVANCLDQIAAVLQARPILLSIGICHGDDDLSKSVANEMASSPVIVDKHKSLISVAACISHSVAYYGSSMHGYITASSYGVPAVCVANREMVKFKGLIELVGNSGIVADSWVELAKSIVDNTVSGLHDLTNIHAHIREEIDDHWKMIEKVLFIKDIYVTQNKNEENIRSENYQDYESAILSSSLKLFTRVNSELSISKREVENQLSTTGGKLVKLENEVIKLSGQISEHVNRINTFKVKIDLLHSSLSWKLTKPLRYLSAKNPRVAKVVGSMLRKSNSIIKQKVVNAQVKIRKCDWGPPSDIASKVEYYKKNIPTEERKVVICTALFGGYDTLMLPNNLESNIDYVCFTDSQINSFGVWQIRAAPYYHPDPTRISRYVKTHLHELFAGYDTVVWVDSNIVIRGDISNYIDIVERNNAGIGFVVHPHRDCVYDEAEACKKLNKDQDAVIDKQVKHYRDKKYPSKSGMYETGFLVVNLNDHVIPDFFRYWWNEIELYSKRDQLSVGWALVESKVKKTQLMPVDITVRNNLDFTIFPHEEARCLLVPKQLEKYMSIQEPDLGAVFSDVRDARLEQVKNISIDIVVCVYNALEDVKLCLSAVVKHLTDNANIIIVNDVSNEETTEFLQQFSKNNEKVTLLENEQNLGYTRSANQGLQACRSDFRIMLNSDTIVSKDWALKMVSVAYSSKSIGIVGPLSNAAGSQSIPEIKSTKGQTAINQLPKGVELSDIDLACEKWSAADLYPRVPLIHGFCFGIKNSVIESIGYFDDVNFKRYYGEENDYCFRARAAGFEFAIATNVFVYHRKSRSIEEEERIVHMDKAGKRLRELYGAKNVSLACRQMADHPLLIQLRNNASHYLGERG